jgi:hypothetical protein
MSSCWPHRQLLELLHRARVSVLAGLVSTLVVVSLRVTPLISHTFPVLTRKLANPENVTQKRR